ncbi:MAG TPA: histidine kinase [Gaiellaceae bacterium]|nr:histidine kinase [Gaiellaceae bacterium]
MSGHDDLAARLTAAADGERRRIERDLHDGVQQDLVALAVNLELARQLADSDLATAKTLLEEMRHNVQEALDGVRTLAHDVYPSLLPVRGLADAFRTLPVEVSALARYPLEVEQTVYFCCVELSRHASTPVRVGERDGKLCFAVDEELDADALVGIRDRVAALGGELTVTAGETRGIVPL